MKVKLRKKIVVLLLLPFIVPFMLPGLMQNVFYGISFFTEEIGHLMGRIDSYLYTSFKKFLDWVKK